MTARWGSERAKARFQKFAFLALTFNTVAWVGHLAGWWK